MIVTAHNPSESLNSISGGGGRGEGHTSHSLEEPSCPTDADELGRYQHIHPVDPLIKRYIPI